MIRKQPVSAAVRANANLAQLKEAILRCNACELCAEGRRPVFGDEEDLAGRPFVGPAGKVLAKAMEDVRMARKDVYLTNAVKVFHFEERGKRRIHKKPGAGHIAACRPWLDAEIEVVRPKVIVCLGATAAQRVVGRVTQIKAERGQNLSTHPVRK